MLWELLELVVKAILVAIVMVAARILDDWRERADAQ